MLGHPDGRVVIRPLRQHRHIHAAERLAQGGPLTFVQRSILVRVKSAQQSLSTKRFDGQRQPPRPGLVPLNRLVGE